jgi:hypothetical protein
MKKALLIILLSFQFIAHAQWTSYNLPQDFPVYYEFTDLIYSSKILFGLGIELLLLQPTKALMVVLILT